MKCVGVPVVVGSGRFQLRTGVVAQGQVLLLQLIPGLLLAEDVVTVRLGTETAPVTSVRFVTDLAHGSPTLGTGRPATAQNSRVLQTFRPLRQHSLNMVGLPVALRVPADQHIVVRVLHDGHVRAEGAGHQVLQLGSLHLLGLTLQQ